MADLTITELQEDTTLTGTEEIPIWDSGTTKKATLDAVKTFVGASAGVSDHGALTGLGDDDHPHYFNGTRGDARYSQLGHNHSGVYEPAGTAATAVSGHLISYDHTLLHAPGSDNQDLSGYSLTSHTHTDLHSHTNKTTLDKITEAAGEPLWNGSAWPGGAGGGTGDMLASVYDADADGKINYNDLANKPTIPTLPTLATVATSGSYTDLSGVPTTFAPSTHNHAVADTTGLQTALDAKQATLVSGTNIKTINSQSLLGSGDIVISGSGMTNPMTAAGDIIIGGTSGAPTRLAKGTDGQNLALVSGVPAWVTAASGGSLLVAEQVVSVSAVASVTFTGLDGSADGGYTMMIDIKAVSGSANPVWLYVNGDTTNSNYTEQYTGYGVASAIRTEPFLTWLDGNYKANIELHCGVFDSSFWFWSTVRNVRWNGTSYSLETGGNHIGVIANITSLTIQMPAGQIGIGSTFRLYKRK